LEFEKHPAHAVQIGGVGRFGFAGLLDIDTGPGQFFAAVSPHEAEKMIRQALKTEPDNVAYLDSMGWVLFKLQLAQEALPWMLKAVELSPDPDATILDHLGDVYMSLHQTAKALENWKKSYAIDPNEDVKKKLQSFDAGAT